MALSKLTKVGELLSALERSVEAIRVVAQRRELLCFFEREPLLGES